MSSCRNLVPSPSGPSIKEAKPLTSAPELSVVLPCLNEARTLRECIETIQHTLKEHGIHAEIIVADNGSTDESVSIAQTMGVRVVSVPLKGYGSALVGGITAAAGKYVLVGDCDATYDFSHIPRFLVKLREGNDLVMGNRFQGGIAVGAMPALHRYLGNPALSLIGRIFFHAECGDFHCGLRGFTKAAYEKLGMCTTGMEFASEMVVKATLAGLQVTEVPTTLSPDKRSHPSNLHTWRDGWRHLRFMLLYSPRWLFLYPGLMLILVGLGVSAYLLPRPRTVDGVVFDIHTLLYALTAVLLGFQAVAFAVFTKIYASSVGLLPKNPRLENVLQSVTLEAGLVVGAVLMLAGIAGSVYAVHLWGSRHFGPLNTSAVLRIVAPSVTTLTLGCQIALFSFFLSVLGLARK